MKRAFRYDNTDINTVVAQAIEDEYLAQQELQEQIEKENAWYREYMNDLMIREEIRDTYVDLDDEFYTEQYSDYDWTEEDYFQMAFPEDFALCREDIVAMGGMR